MQTEPCRTGCGRRPALARLLLGLAACLAGWVALTPAVAGDAAPLVIATTRSPLSLLVHVAELRGFFAAEGVDVRTLECGSGQRCLERVFDKSAQFATAADLPVVLNTFQRDDFTVLATIGRTPHSVKLVGSRKAGLAKPADLKGKRIGVLKGSSSQYFLDAYLLFNGIDPKQVTVLGVPYEQAKAAFAARQIDAFVSTQDRLARIVIELGSDAVVFEDSRIYTTTVNLVSDRRVLAERPADVVRLLRALERARRLVVEQPEQAKAVLRERVREPASVDWILKTHDFRLGLDQSLMSTMAGEARWAVREGHVDKAQKIPNLLNFIEPAPLRTAVPSALP